MSQDAETQLTEEQAMQILVAVETVKQLMALRPGEDDPKRRRRARR